MAILELARSQNFNWSNIFTNFNCNNCNFNDFNSNYFKNLSKAAAKLIPEDVMMITNTHNVSEDTENHVIVLGYGRFGQTIVEELKIWTKICYFRT